MNRNKVVAGSCLALLAVISIGQYYLDKGDTGTQRVDAPQAPAPEAEHSVPPPETAQLTVDELIAGVMVGFEQESEAGKLVALSGLVDALETPEFAKSVISAESAEPLAQAALGALETAKGTESEALKARFAGVMAGRMKGATAREATLKTLDQGPDAAREAVLAALGDPRGVGGREVFARVQHLSTTGGVDIKKLPRLLVRLGGRKAVEPVTALMNSSDDWRVISACALALQDYRDPAILGAVLARLEQVGMIDDPKKLPWISEGILNAYLEKAEGADLGRGLRVIRIRSSLATKNSAALERGLGSSDPAIRRSAADATKRGVLSKRITPQEGERLLSGRLPNEEEPVLKAELTGGLDQIRSLIPKPDETQQ